MSTMTMTYFSKALKGCQQVCIYLPIGTEYEDMIEDGEKFQVLWLLHGYGGNFSEWGRYTCIEKLAMDHRFAVVMPDGGHSCYSNLPDGMSYYKYITEELPAFLRKYFPLSDKREDNWIAGLSMGGEGAAMLGFANPDKYSAIGIFSGGPDEPREQFSWYEEREHWKLEDLKDNGYIDFYKNFKEMPSSGYPMPLIYDTIGKDDFLYPGFENFQNYCKELGYEDYVIFDPVEGHVHSWDFWDLSIGKFVDLLPLKHRNSWRKWYDSVDDKVAKND